jgi:hypothetical protein
MTEYDRRRDRIQSFQEMQIAMTQSGVRGVQQDLVRRWFRNLQRFDRHRLMSHMKDGCAHGVPSLLCDADTERPMRAARQRLADRAAPRPAPPGLNIHLRQLGSEARIFQYINENHWPEMALRSDRPLSERRS